MERRFMVQVKCNTILDSLGLLKLLYLQVENPEKRLTEPIVTGFELL